ncbi:hypothetical protein COA17_11010 [Sphingomonas ginsenosidimutans]|jgi:hypothetical protein|uniref:DUF4398 domain-containing protein n=1 Tax=Sphingomonas ginsenosidimutans TaxID=862134 RepID=A0A2A4HXP6_9SPHN|nr:hypothetical protein [Sphingomonas ginsenosidimutans]PCG08679.1 hypothetical protein COA17_11010 [Sphingomonas ginsenosidimutans]
MRRASFAALAAAALAVSACASIPTPSPAAIDRLDASFDRLQRASEPVLPLLPEERAVRVRATLAAIAIAIDAARLAATANAQRAAIARADAQVEQLAGALNP